MHAIGKVAAKKREREIRNVALIIGRKFASRVGALGLIAHSRRPCSRGREQSKAVEVVRARDRRTAGRGGAIAPLLSLPRGTVFPHSVVVEPSFLSLTRSLPPLSPAASSFSVSLDPSPAVLRPSHSHPHSSLRSFLTSNHLGPRTSAVSRSFLAAAFRHFPPDRARGRSGKRHFDRRYVAVVTVIVHSRVERVRQESRA